jgi:glycosyltransferase involved in cell wall biosynthesis
MLTGSGATAGDLTDSFRPLKVLLVGPVPPPFGGIPKYVADLLAAKLEGVEWSHFNTAMPAWVAPLDREGRFSYRSLTEDGPWVALRKSAYVAVSFARFLAKVIGTRPDVVHVFTCSFWGYWRSLTYLCLAKLCRLPTILHLLNAIDIFYESSGSVTRGFLRRSFRTADLYVLQSEGLARWLRQYTRRTALGFFNAIDRTRLPEPVMVEYPVFRLGFPVGLTVGALGGTKGTADILKALQRLTREGLDTGWLFVGRGDREKYSGMAAELALTDRVFFAGEIDEASKWGCLRQSDFFCLPSYSEGQPIAIIEAMTAGLPIIATAIGTIPEMVNSENAILIEPGDSEALTQAIARLVRSGELRTRMGQESARLGRENHDFDVLLKNLKQAYATLPKRVAGSAGG